MNSNQKEEFRYWYAGLALQGLLSNTKYMEKKALELKVYNLGENDMERYVAVDAVDCADALIAELEKGGRKCCG